METAHKIKMVKNRFGTIDKYYRDVKIYKWHGKYGGKGWCVKFHTVRNDENGNYEPHRYEHSAFVLKDITDMIDHWLACEQYVIDGGYLVTPSYQTWEKAQREQRQKEAELAREKWEQDELERLRNLAPERLAQEMNRALATLNRINKVIQEKGN